MRQRRKNSTQRLGSSLKVCLAILLLIYCKKISNPQKTTHRYTQICLVKEREKSDEKKLAKRLPHQILMRNCSQNLLISQTIG